MLPALLEMTKDFRFEAAHTLQRDIGAEGSRRIHGHSYRARVAVRGRPDPATGMVIDLEKLEQLFAAIRARLDHHFLDEVEGLGPATMENLAVWIWRCLAPDVAGLSRVTLYRDSLGESCTYLGE
ncbi:6-carboxytetrahydropterin synthase [Ferrovibrio xuzhouensis]|uniref:6-carboxy-5,6,7,8-tetrahydropterin synthase n=1 Tax=Ferrovibrio xuzhouensis TaxID=1576914 RepID=A0ABV7VI96_9PROT